MNSQIILNLATPCTRDKIEEVADQEIAEFNSWFVNKFTGQGDISRYERAILKTYIIAKLNNSKDVSS